MRAIPRTARAAALVVIALACGAAGCTRAQRTDAPPGPVEEASPAAGGEQAPPAAGGEPDAGIELPDPAGPRDPAAGPPAGFEPVGSPEVSDPWLEPREAWRDLVSRLILRRADARRTGSPLLVTFAPDAVHVTGRDGRRRTLRLPPGLRLEGVPVHLLLASDLGMRAWGPDGTEILLGEEVTVVRGVLTETGANVEDFRLLVKGGQTFRSIP